MSFNDAVRSTSLKSGSLGSSLPETRLFRSNHKAWAANGAALKNATNGGAKIKS
ncbi:MAG: hypothetical protein U5R46_12785 [Gammaproteobacteria bacterium]|nr:hypothetical protein [Gammaproteobacteria bacterium]